MKTSMNTLMNTLMKKSGRSVHHGRSLLTVALTSALLIACASDPVAPSGSAEARAKLSALQANPERAARVPVAMREAEAAVELAEQPVGSDSALGAHRVRMADRRVEIAMARAAKSEAEAQREGLMRQSTSARLEARTREADRAQSAAESARSDAASARSETERARSEAEARRRSAAAESDEEAARLRKQIEELEARETDRGLVLTLGDVLFETARSDLRAGATSNLGKLVAFLEEYPERTVVIEGHTDSVGAEDYNQGLSQRRADAVGAWLTQSGIDRSRVSASGKGMHHPVADNSSANGRQMNRRVEVIIENRPAASR